MKYNRLTKKHDIYDIYIADCKACENKNSLRCIKRDKEEKGVGKLCDVQKGERLAELEDKIENGTLVELPCKVGSEVYVIHDYGFGRLKIEQCRVVGFNFSPYEDTVWIVNQYGNSYTECFETYELAQERLNKIKNNEQS